MVDLRTPKQKATAALHQAIAERYAYYRREAGGASNNAIYIKLASEFGVSSTHCRQVCLRSGVATTKRAGI